MMESAGALRLEIAMVLKRSLILLSDRVSSASRAVRKGWLLSTCLLCLVCLWSVAGC